MTSSILSRLRRMVAHRLTSLLVLGLGAAAILFVFVRYWGELSERMASIGLAEVMIAVPLSCMMMLASGLTFAFLAHAGHAEARSIFSAAGVYLLAQPLKYLPGRIWTAIYQVAKVGQQVGTRAALGATLSQLWLTVFISLLMLDVASQARLNLLAAGCLVSMAWIWRGGAERYLAPQELGNRSAGNVFLVSLSVVIEWAMFMGVVWLICLALAEPKGAVFELAAVYAIAWLLGSLVAVAPGGIVVREGGFVAMAAVWGFPLEFAASFAVVARFSFLFAEVLCAVAAWMFLRKEQGSMT